MTRNTVSRLVLMLLFTSMLTTALIIQPAKAEMWPIARFSCVPTVLFVDEMVTFDATDSYDPDGSIISYLWDFGDGTTVISTDPVTMHIYSAEGPYTITLTVTDNDELTDTCARDVLVLATPAAIYIDPPTVTAASDESFTININIADVVDLRGWQIELSWDQHLLEVVDVTEGPFLKEETPTPLGTIFVYRTYDDYMLVGCTQCEPQPGVSGSGTLMSVTFHVKDAGESALHLFDTILITSEIYEIPHTTADGYFHTPMPAQGIRIDIKGGSEVQHVSTADYFYVRHGWNCHGWSNTDQSYRDWFLLPDTWYFTLETNAVSFEHPPLQEWVDYDEAADILSKHFWFQFKPGDLVPGSYSFTGRWYGTGPFPDDESALLEQRTITLIVDPWTPTPAPVPKFLTLPFRDQNIKVQSAWVEHVQRGTAGIDYVKGRIDDSITWRPFDVLAAADGWAMWSEAPRYYDPEKGKWINNYGTFVLIRHDEKDSNGNDYFTLYAHLASVSTGIPDQDRHNINDDYNDASKWKYVERGEVIGRAGNTGAPNTGIHLHFEVQRGGYTLGRTDPYDLDEKREFYPNARAPHGKEYTSCGANHLWITDPPALPPIFDNDVYWLAKAIMSEAEGYAEQEQIAVGWTVLNRLDSGIFENSIEAIVTSPGQYAYGKEPTKEIEALAKRLLEGEIPDPTDEATHFFSPISMPKLYTWWKIQYQAGVTGWSAENWLEGEFAEDSIVRTTTDNLGVRYDPVYNDYLKMHIIGVRINVNLPKGSEGKILEGPIEASTPIVTPEGQSYDIDGGLHLVPSDPDDDISPADRQNKVWFPGFAKPEEGTVLTETTARYLTADEIRVQKKEWKNLPGIRNWNFMFYRFDVPRADAGLNCPAELRVYDTQGRVTGLVDGTVVTDIPGSVCFGDVVTIFFPNDTYRYAVAGITEGLYNLTVTAVTRQENITFSALDIPTSTEAFHQYTVDWAALSPGEEGVTIQVDSEGDGVFEHTFSSDSELTQTEYVIGTDGTPPETWLTVYEPKFLANDVTYLTSITPIELVAEDNTGGSGLASTAYRISNATYDSGWTAYAEPFYLIGLGDGTYQIAYNSTDVAGNVELSNTVTVILDNTEPSVTVENPPAGWALQDGVTFIISAIDASGTSSMNISIREADGGLGTPVGFEELPAIYDAVMGKWTLFFDTLQLPDGYYTVIVKADDNLGHTSSTTVSYSIRNWAVLELLPASDNNKAGRTMPVKFSLRVAAAVDPLQPFVYNEDLTIDIYATDTPDEILQASTFGDDAGDYRINSLTEVYITNFKTLRTPREYRVEVYRKDLLIDSFPFHTVK